MTDFNQREVRIIARAVEQAAKSEGSIRLDPGEPYDIRKIAQELHLRGINIVSSLRVDTKKGIVRFAPRNYGEEETVTEERLPGEQDFEDLYSIFNPQRGRRK